jgi:cob(I)alamin adenosyltransferase
VGVIYLYTGNGGGKSSNSLGLVLRTCGHGKKALVVQFLKWNKNTGEYLAANKLGYEIYQFGREGWHGVDNLSPEDIVRSEEALAFAFNKVTTENYNLLVLDEINLLNSYGLVSDDLIIELLDEITLRCPETSIICTGRNASDKLKARADVVNEIVEIKAPKFMICDEGIQF